MKKALLIPLLFIIACIFAGTYGAFHNQISYTVAPEYFTAFKFHQFQLTESFASNRVKAAIVGWNASWWMGIIIGIVIIPLGWVIPGAKDYFTSQLLAFLVVAITALVVGLAALLISFLTIDSKTVGEITIYGNEIIDDISFARAGTMHNFSYLGGFFGIFSGTYLIFKKRKHLRALQSK